MKEQHMQENRSDARGPCGMMAGHTHPMKWCGMFPLIAGLLWLSVLAGWLPADLFWPIFLVLMGTLMIAVPLWRRAAAGGPGKTTGA